MAAWMAAASTEELEPNLAEVARALFGTGAVEGSLHDQDLAPLRQFRLAPQPSSSFA